jgi:hypothetical protein
MTVDEAVKELEKGKGHIKFSRALKIATEFFGVPRITGSHHNFRMPWAGDPRVNLQPEGHMTKRYQGLQLLQALRKLKGGANG